MFAPGFQWPQFSYSNHIHIPSSHPSRLLGIAHSHSPLNRPTTCSSFSLTVGVLNWCFWGSRIFNREVGISSPSSLLSEQLYVRRWSDLINDAQNDMATGSGICCMPSVIMGVDEKPTYSLSHPMMWWDHTKHKKWLNNGMMCQNL
jgi:hypothetical protein